MVVKSKGNGTPAISGKSIGLEFGSLVGPDTTDPKSQSLVQSDFRTKRSWRIFICVSIWKLEESPCGSGEQNFQN